MRIGLFAEKARHLELVNFIRILESQTLQK